MSLVEEQWKFQKDLALFIIFAEMQGMMLTGGEQFRTKAQQALYFKTGLSQTMNSKHLLRLAMDFNVFCKVDGHFVYLSTDELALKHGSILGKFWKKLNPKKNVSGFDWGWDFFHFERRI